MDYISENWLEILGTIVGLVYLWLELKASIYLWIAGVIMPAIYIFVYYDAGLYADFGIQVYYLFAAFYGLAVWMYSGQKDVGSHKKELPITHMPLRSYTKAIVMFGVAYAAILYILLTYTNSDVPYLDTFTTALSIVGMWMLARKYIEQWIAWIAVDGVCVGLYIYKGIYATAALYLLYTIIAVYGYFEWKRRSLSTSA